MSKDKTTPKLYTEHGPAGGVYLPATASDILAAAAAIRNSLRKTNRGGRPPALNPSQIKYIQASDDSTAKLAAAYGVSESTIRRVRRGAEEQGR